MDEGQTRIRTHEWSEPVALAEGIRRLSGLEWIEAWSSGEMKWPMATTLGFGVGDFGDGHIELICTPEEFHYNPFGTLHGGLAATLLDTATGSAIATQLPAGVGYATINLAVNFLKPITTGTGPVRCLGKVVSMGRTVAVSEADVVDSSERVLARATATCILINPEGR